MASQKRIGSVALKYVPILVEQTPLQIDIWVNNAAGILSMLQNNKIKKLLPFIIENAALTDEIKNIKSKGKK